VSYVVLVTCVPGVDGPLQTPSLLVWIGKCENLNVEAVRVTVSVTPPAPAPPVAPPALPPPPALAPPAPLPPAPALAPPVADLPPVAPAAPAAPPVPASPPGTPAAPCGAPPGPPPLPAVTVVPPLPATLPPGPLPPAPPLSADVHAKLARPRATASVRSAELLASRPKAGSVGPVASMARMVSQGGGADPSSRQPPGDYNAGVDDESVAVHEHLAFHSPIDLQPLCDAVRMALDLPAFEFGSEGENAWGLCRHQGVEYNLSMPPELGMLQEWDDTVPGWCNVGLTLLVFGQHPHADDPYWIVTTLVRGVGERLAATLKRPVVYHRTSLPVGGGKFRPHVFPAPGKR
jgi:hypothetical protein